MLLEEFLSYDNMTLCDARNTLFSSSSSVSLYLEKEDSDLDVAQAAVSRNRAIMLTCLYLEGVAVCAKVCHL